MARGKKKPTLASGGRPIVLDKVVSPYVGFDRVPRVLDSITAMHRRRQLTDRQYAEAVRYRTAHDALLATMKGTLDPDKVGGSSSVARTPGAPLLDAGAVLRETHAMLGQIDSIIVAAIVGEGLSVDDVARRLYGGDGKERDAFVVGRRLRDALDLMADSRSGAHRPGRARITAYLEEGARPTVPDGPARRLIPRPEKSD